MKTRTAAIIVAAGKATRFGSPKVLRLIGPQPALARVVGVFQATSDIDQVVVVINAQLRDQVEGMLANVEPDSPVTLVDGGARRQDSVLTGLQAAPDADIVVVHDAARPLVTAELIRAAVAGIEEGADAAICAVPVSDTVKRAIGDRIETIDRTGLWRAQTPQAFRREVLLRALLRARDEGLEVTDEAMLIERAGGRVKLVAGSERNLKLTVPEDAVVMEALVSSSTGPPYRTGIGYDVHRLVPGRALVLGGVRIPSEMGLDGHSDADVLLHAICDALLGAGALGDIGHHFPPGDPQYRGISSLPLLEKVRALLEEHGYAIVNVDATVVAESPRIGPHAADMRQAIAGALHVTPDRIGIKATTNEGIGFAGRREGIAATAVATIWKTG